MSKRAPAPLVPAEVDLSGLPYMPLHVERLRRSKHWRVAKARPEIGFYALNLWAGSWHERPAASLPDDDLDLADFASCDASRWPEVKAESMRGFVLCSDGRWYHRVVAELALEAWNILRKQKARTAKATETRRKRAAPGEPPSDPTNAERQRRYRARKEAPARDARVTAGTNRPLGKPRLSRRCVTQK